MFQERLWKMHTNSGTTPLSGFLNYDTPGKIHFYIRGGVSERMLVHIPVTTARNLGSTLVPQVGARPKHLGSPLLLSQAHQ